MQRYSICSKVSLVTTLLGLFVLREVKGDGGIIRLRETQGPFSITVFSSSEAVSGQLLDVSALIQESKSGAVVLDADVRLALSAPDGSVMKQSDDFCGTPMGVTRRSLDGPDRTTRVRATREKGFNKLLYSALVELNASGNWKLRVLVSRGSETAQFGCLLPVASSSVTLKGLLPYLLLPPLVVAAFVLNQWLRTQS